MGANKTELKKALPVEKKKRVARFKFLIFFKKLTIS